MGRELNPATRELIDRVEQQRMPSWPALSVENNRRLMEELCTSPEPVREVGTVKQLEADLPRPCEPVALRIYEPEREPPFPAQVYYHGGGWVLGDLQTHDNLCRLLCAHSDCMIVSVDYRRAPEHPFPEGFLDCFHAVRWVFNNAGNLGVDPDRVGVGGDSAGGNLAAAVARKAAREGTPDLAHQMLLYPVLDYSLDYSSFEENAEGYMLETADMHWFWNHYLPHGIHGENPYVSPLVGEIPGSLAPAHIVTCEFDPLRDQGIKYAEKLEERGFDVSHQHYDGEIHGFLTFLHEPDLPGASRALATLGQKLHGAL